MMTRPATIHVGYEVRTGTPVAVPARRHIAVTGQTQMSGKTTTLEAMIDRSRETALAFITKRGEGSFAMGRRVQPYFRDRADWQFVDQLLEAQLQEKNKFLRPWIIRICRTTKTLADVQRAVRTALETAKGINQGVYTQLDAYLDLIVPEIQQADLAEKLDLGSGLNVMDVGAYSTPMQMLFIQSAIDWINDQRENTIVVIPEAWETIPQGRGSPVKASARSLVRKGAGLGNLIWVDSQDMAGVEKEILRGCTVWLIGVQREANEIERALSNIPAGMKKPKAADVATLGRGEFFVCWENQIHRTYVQPAWMDAEEARAIALGEKSIDDVKRPIEMHVNTRDQRGRKQKLDRRPAGALGRAAVAQIERSPPGRPAATATADDDEEFTEAEMKQLDHLTEIAEKTLGAMEKLAKAIGSQPGRAAPDGDASAPARSSNNDEENMDIDTLYAEIKKRLTAEAPALLKVLATKPEMEITIEKPTIESDTKSLFGRVAYLVATGWFKEQKKNGPTCKELARTGKSVHPTNLGRELDKLIDMGFLTDEADGFQEVAGAKVRIINKK